MENDKSNAAHDGTYKSENQMLLELSSQPIEDGGLLTKINGNET